MLIYVYRDHDRIRIKYCIWLVSKYFAPVIANFACIALDLFVSLTSS